MDNELLQQKAERLAQRVGLRLRIRQRLADGWVFDQVNGGVKARHKIAAVATARRLLGI